MSIISYLSLSISPPGVVHVGTAAYTSCLERGGEGETRRQQKSVSLFLYGPMTKTSCQTLLWSKENRSKEQLVRNSIGRDLSFYQSTLLLFLYCCIFLLCVFRYVYFI
jgi:hypothetical protein